MNQQPRYVKMKCCKCKENEVEVREEYNPHISDYEINEIPICEECKRKGENV